MSDWSRSPPRKAGWKGVRSERGRDPEAASNPKALLLGADALHGSNSVSDRAR